ncbi:glycosyltransferase family 4 protein [Patescibacteria group bacterium]|nr:glycosyltransferase family 4 protein [Patescibacteria group bacterium]MBU1921875.1 glycosyltransferase family 4 protein [Patescibacteria group bacterium]
MKIALVSKLWEATSPHSMGGTGSSVGQLANELVRRGHKVTLFATRDSKTRARLIAVQPKPFRGNYSEIREYMNISEAFKRHQEFDIINCHVEHKACFFAPLVKTSVLITIRYGEFFAQEMEFLKKSKNLNFSANSKALRKHLAFLNWRGHVYNGVDLSIFRYSAKPKDYVLFLGRLSPQKGVDIAIRAARRARKKLIIAGKMVDRDADFLKKKVIPYIDGKRVIYRGEVGLASKVRLLGEAQAVLQPVNYFEACSNTILEAMASGTPVIAFDRGSNRELVVDKRTGFIVKKRDQMVSALKKINIIQRADCRARAEKYFSVEKMARDYEALYKKIIKKR